MIEVVTIYYSCRLILFRVKVFAIRGKRISENSILVDLSFFLVQIWNYNF
jgi:hypothetical protein